MHGRTMRIGKIHHLTSPRCLATLLLLYIAICKIRCLCYNNNMWKKRLQVIKTVLRQQETISDNNPFHLDYHNIYSEMTLTGQSKHLTLNLKYAIF